MPATNGGQALNTASALILKSPGPPPYCETVRKTPASTRRGANIIVARSRTHGRYEDNATTAQRIKEALRCASHWSMLTAPQRESLELIATKMGRITSGNPNIRDHWDDISGYAELISKQLR